MKNSKKYLLTLELREAMENNSNLIRTLLDKGDITNNNKYYQIIRSYLYYDNHLNFRLLSAIAYNCYSKQYKTTKYEDIHYFITYINGCIEATKKVLELENLEY